jgi:hypothetical protein
LSNRAFRAFCSELFYWRFARRNKRHCHNHAIDLLSLWGQSYRKIIPAENKIAIHFFDKASTRQPVNLPGIVPSATKF